jgi:hypothetical protein
MSIINLSLAPGDDLFRVAAEYYNDPTAWTLIARANGLWDPLIQTDIVVTIPDYNASRANGGSLV